MKRICLKCGNYTDGATCPYCKPTWKERALEDKLVEELCKKIDFEKLMKKLKRNY